jgi:hypothetical protein
LAVVVVDVEHHNLADHQELKVAMAVQALLSLSFLVLLMQHFLVELLNQQRLAEVLRFQQLQPLEYRTR